MDSMPVIFFVAFVGFVLGLSFYLARKASSASGYFAAGGNIHWFVNGIAFAGDYLSAASFLGICGLIATLGYDGFLYSIGYLAGWIMAMFVVAEPMKRLGRYTFTDALDSTFNSRGIQLAAGISTMVVSIFYLIPQMVGAGVLVTPLLGLPHAVGVMMVGAIVIVIVATAGMKSTTYVQFLKGGLLILFSGILVVAVCMRGFTTKPTQGGKVPFHEYRVMSAKHEDGRLVLEDDTHSFAARQEIQGHNYVKLAKHRIMERDADGTWGFVLRGNNVKLPAGITQDLDRLLEQAPGETRSLAGLLFARVESGLEATTEFWWKEQADPEGNFTLHELASVAHKADGTFLLNGLPATPSQQLQVGNLLSIAGRTGEEATTGSIDPVKFLSLLGHPETVVRRWKQEASFTDGGFAVTVFASVPTSGNRIMRPGLYFKVDGTRLQRMDFVSLMLALFLGTAALPHILIRYYTVPSPAAARKSTIVAITSIGLFYVLTLFMGLGAMVSGVLDPADSNMAAPLLARSFGGMLFAVISAIAFATVLGTVSGLIVAASGAVAHDLLDRYCDLGFNERQKVVIGKATALTVGLVAIILGIVFKGMNVSYLVGWAFAVAASANLPAILMLLFWKRTTASGIVASIIVGIVAAVGLILLSPDMYARYGLQPESAPVQLNQPAIVSVPLSFVTLVIVSLFTKRKVVGSAAVHA